MSALEDILGLGRSELSRAQLDELAEQRTREGFTLEYKRELGNGNGTLSAVSAMANTFGGVILVGIDEQRDDGQAFGIPGPAGLAGVDHVERSRLANLCVTRLVPPYVPEIIAIPVDNGREVLVVRISPDLANRPLFYGNRVFARTEAGNVYADRFRLLELATEGRSGAAPSDWIFGADSPENHIVWTEGPPADLFVRLVSRFPVISRRRHPRIPERARNELGNRLTAAPLHQWLLRCLPGESFHAWHHEGISTTQRAELQWHGCVQDGRPFPEARCTVELPPRGAMSVTIDIILRESMLQAVAQDRGATDSAKPRLGLDDLLDLFISLLDAQSVAVLPSAPELADGPVGPPLGPVCHVTAHARPIADAVILDSLPLIPGNTPGRGTGPMTVETSSLKTESDQRMQAREWLIQLLQDCHYQDAELFVDKAEEYLRARG